MVSLLRNILPWLQRLTCKTIRGIIANSTSARIQLAIRPIVIPTTTVEMFWTNVANASPTKFWIIEASLDSLAPIAPLYLIKFRVKKFGKLRKTLRHLRTSEIYHEFAGSSNQLISWYTNLANIMERIRWISFAPATPNA